MLAIILTLSLPFTCRDQVYVQGNVVLRPWEASMLGACGGMGWEGVREMGDSCCFQLQVCGHLSLNGDVRRCLIAILENLSPDTPHIRKHASPYSLCSPTQCRLYLPFSPHLPLMLLGFNTRHFRYSYLVFILNLNSFTFHHFFFPSLSGAIVPELPGRCCILSTTTQPCHCLLCLTQWTWLMGQAQRARI